MNRTPRFTGPSDAIDLDRLEREDRPFWYTGFMVGVAALSLLMLLPLKYRTRTIEIHDEHTVSEVPIVLVIRPPRLPNPYLMRRRDATRRIARARKAFRRRIPDTSGIPVSPRTDPMAELLARPHNYPADAGESFVYVIPKDLPPEIRALVDPPAFEIERTYQDLTISREPSASTRGRFSLMNELIAVEDFDYGRFMAALAPDPDDRTAVRGFVHIPSAVFGATLEAPATVRRAMQGLAEAVEKYSGLTVTVGSPVYIDQLNASEYPLLYLAADETFDLSPIERESLAAWLKSGGFLIAEACGEPIASGGPPDGAMSLRRMLDDVLGPAGGLRTIPSDHFLYSCFHDFPDGPPRGPHQPAESLNVQLHDYLEGVWLGERLAVIYSEKGYGEALHNSETNGATGKFAVNLLLCLLLQKSERVLKIVDGVVFTK